MRDVVCLGTALAALGASACAVPGTRARVTTPACAVPPAVASADLTLRGAAGHYRLRLVATSGPRSGGTVDGDLTLEDTGAPARVLLDSAGVRMESRVDVRGTLAIRLAPVAAKLEGTRTSGEVVETLAVTVVERRLVRPATGSAAYVTLWLRGPLHGENVVVTDGRSMILTVTSRAPSGLAGRWESSPRYGDAAAGYFCAVRL